MSILSRRKKHLGNGSKYFYEKLKMKGIILRSTEDGYKIKNMLRLTIGSKNENLKFMKAVKKILKKCKIY